MKNRCNLKWFRIRPVDDQVRIYREEEYVGASQVSPPMHDSLRVGEKRKLFKDDAFDTIGERFRALFLDVPPDVY